MGNGSIITFFLSLAAANVLAAEPLRTVQDASRNRVWVLERDAIYLHEGAQKKRYELPGWTYVTEAYACSPDVTVDGQGAAVVTSNIVPVVWRVEPAKARVTRHELVLDADTGKDVGFTGLTYAADQNVFFAVSAIYGTLWRIDPLLRRAQQIRSRRRSPTPVDFPSSEAGPAAASCCAWRDFGPSTSPRTSAPPTCSRAAARKTAVFKLEAKPCAIRSNRFTAVPGRFPTSR